MTMQNQTPSADSEAVAEGNRGHDGDDDLKNVHLDGSLSLR